MIKLYIRIKIKPYIASVRPKHWLKNIIIFVPLIYAHNLVKPDLFLTTIRCFVVFCFISSAVYVFNDIIDAEKDRKHPVKNKRPIASGQISVRNAIILTAFLFFAGFSLAVIGQSNYYVVLLALSYVVLNFAYSFILKHIVIVDCFCIAAGFVLRIFVGGAANNDRITEWLFLTITVVSLFMAFGKRRGEMIHVNDYFTTRKILANYDLQFLNGMMFVCAGLSVTFYALWAMTSVPLMIYTVPLVIFIICKYLLIIYCETSHGDPTSIILGDKSLMIASGLFGMISVILLYL